MLTDFQQNQAADIRRENASLIARLETAGAVAKIAFVHYPGRHTNVNVVLTTGVKHPSKTIQGDDPLAAIANYAKHNYGAGTLRSLGREHRDDGSFDETFLVFQGCHGVHDELEDALDCPECSD